MLKSDEFVEKLADSDDRKLSDTDTSSGTETYRLYLVDG
jgi:hypothetical protein